jgi:hypothetical protein
VGSRSVDMEGSGDEENVMCQVGTVQGEDYTFRFGGKIVDGKLHFRLNMEYEGEDDEVTDRLPNLLPAVWSESTDRQSHFLSLPSNVPGSLFHAADVSLVVNRRSLRTDSRAPSTSSLTPTLTRPTRLPSTSARSSTSAAQTGAV